MYMAGRSRTGSRPLRTWIFSAPYSFTAVSGARSGSGKVIILFLLICNYVGQPPSAVRTGEGACPTFFALQETTATFQPRAPLTPGQHYRPFDQIVRALGRM